MYTDVLGGAEFMSNTQIPITRFSCPYGFISLFVTMAEPNSLIALRDTLGQYHYLVRGTNMSTATAVPGSGTANLFYAIVQQFDVGAPPNTRDVSPGGIFTSLTFDVQTTAGEQRNVLQITTTNSSAPIIVNLSGPNSITPVDPVARAAGITNTTTLVLAQFDMNMLQSPWSLRNGEMDPVSVATNLSNSSPEGFTGHLRSLAAGSTRTTGLENRTITGRRVVWDPLLTVAYESFGARTTLNRIVAQRTYAHTSATYPIQFHLLNTATDDRTGVTNAELPAKRPYQHRLLHATSVAGFVTGVSWRSITNPQGTVVDLVLTDFSTSDTMGNVRTEGDSGPAPTGSTGNLTWLWVLLSLLVVGGGIGAAYLYRRAQQQRLVQSAIAQRAGTSSTTTASSGSSTTSTTPGDGSTATYGLL